MSEGIWVSFCMSTYKRPEILDEQLKSLSKQTFRNFEVIISDNDPEASASQVVSNLNDPRFRYFKNGENLGMIKSFNKSLARSNSEYIIMITDDDPVSCDMLENFRTIVQNYPGFPIYCACIRTGKEPGFIEQLPKERFAFELLHPEKTPAFLWSSCLLRRDIALRFGMPDYGSPHLADHAMLALCSKDDGGVFINQMFGKLSLHATNFSKSNFQLYYKGCIGFHELMTSEMKSELVFEGVDVLQVHLNKWFILNSFSLRRYFSFIKPDKNALNDIDHYSKMILALPFMESVKLEYRAKMLKFTIKKILYKSRLVKFK